MPIVVRSPEIQVKQEDPFEFDALDRAILEPPLSTLLINANGPFVLGLDGEWGTGKTTFVKMWEQSLINQGCTCLYFNAWETDFADDPLIALASELTITIERIVSKKAIGIDISSQLSAVRNGALYLTKKLVPASVRFITMNTLNFDEEIKNTIATLVGDVVEDSLSSYERTKTELNEFRTALEKLIGLIAQADESPHPLIIFVDELDRCRPSYAIELLERIKHLFSIPGIVFVLSMDKQQLSHSIRALYGSDFNAVEYLRRFIDLEYRLPEPIKSDLCPYLLNNFNIKQSLKNRSREFEQIRSLLSFLFLSANFNFRKQLQAVSRLNIALLSIPQNHYLYNQILVILIFLREWNTTLYHNFINGNINVDTLVDQLHSELPILNSETHQVNSREYTQACYIETVFLFAAQEIGQTSKRLERYEKICKDNQMRHDTNNVKAINLPLKNDEEKKAAVIMDSKWDLFRNQDRVGLLKTVARLEMTEDFVFDYL